jgi:hypothetical protein
MHGLGIVSHFREFSNDHYNLENALFPLLPFWKFVFHDQNVMENMTIHALNSTLKDTISPPTIFDKYIRVYPTNEYFYELYNEINAVFGDLLAQNATKETLYDLLAEHPILEKARKAYQLATTKSSLYWIAPIPSEDTWSKYNTSGLMIPQKELKVELETTITNPEHQESAITHLSHSTFKETKDFLMIPYSISGKKLQDIGNANESPIGPYLTRMLDVMGYEMKFGRQGDLSRMYMPGTSFVRNLTLVLAPFLFICLYLFHSKMKRKTGIQS